MKYQNTEQGTSRWTASSALPPPPKAALPSPGASVPGPVKLPVRRREGESTESTTKAHIKQRRGSPTQERETDMGRETLIRVRTGGRKDGERRGGLREREPARL